MNYLARSILPFTINWDEVVARDLTYDLRSESIGYGPEYFTGTATYTCNGWDFALYLQCGADFISFEAFCDSLVGRLNGFWLPCPLDAAQLSAPISTTQFKITAEGLADTWNARPDQHLLFTFADGTQAAGQIQGVVENDDGTETVTLTAALPEAPAAGTVIPRLHYVRFASDEESYDFDAEKIGSIKLTVIELPLEYAEAQTGLRPIYLFDFYAPAPVNTHWRYTSFAATVVSAGNIFAAWPTDFSNLVNSVDGSSDEFNIEAKPDPTHPFSLFLPSPFSGTLYVKVYVADYSAPDLQTVLFAGRVTKVAPGTKWTGTCESRLGFLKRKIPRYNKGQNCQNVLYDPNTCRLRRAFFETTVNIVSIGAGLPTVVVCTFAYPQFPVAQNMQAPGYLVTGQFESGLGPNYEARTIIASSYAAGQLRLTLNLPLYKTQPGVQAQVTAGCDHTGPTCLSYNNFVNFNGFPTIPPRNPTLKAINSGQLAQGGK